VRRLYGRTGVPPLPQNGSYRVLANGYPVPKTANAANHYSVGPIFVGVVGRLFDRTVVSQKWVPESSNLQHYPF